MMGILNVTPDSFSDGGEWFERERAIMRAHEMIEEGADVIDVGGESTRPRAEPVPAAEELRRVIPVIEALAGSVRISIDTTKEEVAEAAVDAGASLINDVSATLWPVAARYGVGWVAMHRQGTPATMQVDPHYDDVVAEVSAMLVDRAHRASQAGLSEVWIDPGIGFGKTVEHNLRLLHSLGDLVATGYPVMVGTSRKSFLGAASTGRRWVGGPGHRAPPRFAGHRHLGHAAGGQDGPGPRRLRHRPGRGAGGTGRPGATGGARPARRCPIERQFGAPGGRQ